MANFLSQVEREIRRLSKERTVLERRIRSLEAVRAEYLKSEPHEISKPKSEPITSRRVEKIAAILREANKPMHYKEIIDRLEQNGTINFEKVKDKGATMTATLSLYKDLFKRVGRGTYALLETSHEITDE